MGCSLAVCLLVSKFSNFSSPHLLFYSCLLCYWPATPSIHRGLEWPQCLNSVSVCSLLVSKFSNFFLFHPPLFIQYSTEECSTVQYKAAGWSGPVMSAATCYHRYLCEVTSKTLRF